MTFEEIVDGDSPAPTPRSGDLSDAQLHCQLDDEQLEALTEPIEAERLAVDESAKILV